VGRVARVLQTEDLLETVEIYSGANVTAKAYGAGGDDAPPLENDRVLLVSIEGTGNYAVAGVLGKSQGAKPGERVLYSRDKDGNVRAVVHLMNDGSVSVVCMDENGNELISGIMGGDGKIKIEKCEEISVADKSGNKIVTGSDGISLTDLKGGKVTMNGKITIQGLMGKIEVS
jgi:hypothetical protein